MLPEQRRRNIVELVSERDGCSVAELAEAFDVSDPTIRRDLADLEAEGLIERSYGGALPVSTVGNEESYDQKRIQQLEEKIRIAQSAVELIQDNQVVFFDNGTTTLQIVKSLPEEKSIVTVTNSLTLAQELDRKGFPLKVTGGSLRSTSKGFVGPSAEQFLERMNFDLLFLATNAIDGGSDIMAPTEREGSMKRRMIENSKRVALVADNTKFEERSFVQFATFEDIDVFVTDAELSDTRREALLDAGTKIVDGV